MSESVTGVIVEEGSRPAVFAGFVGGGQMAVDGVGRTRLALGVADAWRRAFGHGCGLSI
ncbi:hypothetical protein [Streptomyces fuscichromogenes]|uniref:hypothetical protein n=1 Tax=Streptomyces fuscichromogenes TaxID=1324013 RepID=UPI00166FA103|nr:hypothetical protein [Streptomyces fuscichromogenes]